MRVRRGGKCVVCRAKVIQYRTFEENTDILGDSEGLSKKITFQIMGWRSEPILCEEHADVIVKVKEPTHAKPKRARPPTDQSTLL